MEHKELNPWIIFGLFFLFWFGLLILTGTLFSGYHFMDDHGILKESKDVAHSSLQKEVKIFQKNLLAPKMRFRPFYWVHRRLMLAVMGSDFVALSIYIGLLAVFTSFFLYLFMRKIGFSLVETVLFVCLTLWGEQAAIWWRLGNNETLGMFLLSIALLFMALGTNVTHPHQNRKKILYEILFVVFVILATWSKESFILLVPALIFGKIWLTRQKRDPQSAKMTLSNAVKQNLLPGMVLLLVCLLELVHVVKNVGTTGVVYAGYEGFQLAKFIKTAIQGFMSVHGWVILLQLVIIGIVIYFNSKDNKPRAIPVIPLDKLVWSLILVGLIVVPQILLHMKSGMMERYLLPGIMGWIFLMVVLSRYTRETAGKKVIPIIALLLLAVISLQQLRVTRYTAIGFAVEGQHINAWLQSIEQNTREQDMILVITRMQQHFEGAISLKTYLEMKSNRENVLFSPPHLQLGSAVGSFWKNLNQQFFSRFKDFSLKNPADQNRIQAVLLFPGLEEKFLQVSAQWFNPAHFSRYTNKGGFVSFFQKRRH